jgi:hypothetical protein
VNERREREAVQNPSMPTQTGEVPSQDASLDSRTPHEGDSETMRETRGYRRRTRITGGLDRRVRDLDSVVFFEGLDRLAVVVSVLTQGSRLWCASMKPAPAPGIPSWRVRSSRRV